MINFIKAIGNRPARISDRVVFAIYYQTQKRNYSAFERHDGSSGARGDRKRRFKANAGNAKKIIAQRYVGRKFHPELAVRKFIYSENFTFRFAPINIPG